MNKILELRKAAFLSQRELADAINVHQTAISQWETGKTFPDMGTAQALADYFRVSVDYILGRTDIFQEISKGIRIPVLGIIPAGIPIEAIEDVLDHEEISADWTHGGKEYFALKIRGNSMSPKYLENDVVIFLKSEDCNSGDECAVTINGNDATFKRVIKQNGGIVIQPLNASDFEPEFYSNHDIENLPVRIIGIAKELRRKA